MKAALPILHSRRCRYRFTCRHVRGRGSTAFLFSSVRASQKRKRNGGSTRTAECKNNAPLTFVVVRLERARDGSGNGSSRNVEQCAALVRSRCVRGSPLRVFVPARFCPSSAMSGALEADVLTAAPCGLVSSRSRACVSRQVLEREARPAVRHVVVHTNHEGCHRERLVAVSGS